MWNFYTRETRFKKKEEEKEAEETKCDHKENFTSSKDAKVEKQKNYMFYFKMQTISRTFHFHLPTDFYSPPLNTLSINHCKGIS